MPLSSTDRLQAPPSLPSASSTLKLASVEERSADCAAELPRFNASVLAVVRTLLLPLERQSGATLETLRSAWLLLPTSASAEDH